MTESQISSLRGLALEQSRIIAALVKDHGGLISGKTWDEVHKRDEIVPYMSLIDGDDMRIETR